MDGSTGDSWPYIIGIVLAIFLAMVGFSAFVLYLSFRIKETFKEDNKSNRIIKIILLFGILFLAGAMFLFLNHCNTYGCLQNYLIIAISFLQKYYSFIIIFLVAIESIALIRIRTRRIKKHDNIKDTSISEKNTTVQPTQQATQQPNQTTQYHQEYTWIPGKLIFPDQSEILINEKEKQFGRDDFIKGFPDKVKYISRNHFKIINNDGKYYIEDSNSTGGTKLNGTEIKKLGKQLLNKEDKILLAGSLELIFNQQLRQTQYNQEYTMIPGKLILPDQSEILINEKEKLFGRDDFIKKFPEKVKYISRNHFKIINDDGKYYIEDPSSTGGTKLNGVEIKKLGKQLLNEGDKILLAGSLELIFIADMKL